MNYKLYMEVFLMVNLKYKSYVIIVHKFCEIVGQRYKCFTY